MRRIYKIAPIQINDIRIVQVVIDSHYEKKHFKSINDELILQLVKSLDTSKELPVDTKDRYLYFVSLIELNNKSYRLIWMLENYGVYIGIINAHRVKEGKNGIS